MAKHNDSSGIAWFVAGIAVGVAAAVLFAPQSGEETRKSIGDAASKGRDFAKQKKREVVEFSKEALAQGRELAEEAKSKGKEALDRGKQAMPDLSSARSADSSPADG